MPCVHSFKMSLQSQYDWLPDHSSSHMSIMGSHSPFLGTLASLQVAYDLGRRLEDAPGSNSAEKLHHFVFPQHPLKGYENEEILKIWSICSMVYMDNSHHNVTDQLVREDPRPLCVLPSLPSAFDSASAMRNFTSGWFHRFRSLAGHCGGYAAAGSSLGRRLQAEPRGGLRGRRPASRPVACRVGDPRGARSCPVDRPVADGADPSPERVGG